MGEADHKILCVETALAIPDEDNCIVVYTSSQCPESAHQVIARSLGISEHNVHVITRRAGGSFGGKGSQSNASSALAAYKLRRPLWIYVNRNTDMIITGGRHPMKVTYSVGFKSNGTLTALHLDILINAGISEDISPILPSNVIKALKT